MQNSEEGYSIFVKMFLDEDNMQLGKFVTAISGMTRTDRGRLDFQALCQLWFEVGLEIDDAMAEEAESVEKSLERLEAGSKGGATL